MDHSMVEALRSEFGPLRQSWGWVPSYSSQRKEEVSCYVAKE